VYVKNNPTNDVDPSGEFGLIAAFGVGALIGGVLSGVEYYVSHGGRIENKRDFVKHVAIGAFAGGVSGVTGAWLGGALKAGAVAIGFSKVGASLTAGMIGGAASGAAGQAVKNILYRRPIQQGVLEHAMYGAMSGGLVARYLPSLEVGTSGHEAAKEIAKMAVSRVLKLDIELLDRLQTTGGVAYAASPREIVDTVVTVEFLTSGVPAGSQIISRDLTQPKSRYVSVIEELSKHGFNAANPQSPPSGSK
jgi:hypothetical protein